MPFEKLNKLLGDAKLDLNDTKAVIAALHYIVTNVARCAAAHVAVPRSQEWSHEASDPLAQVRC